MKLYRLNESVVASIRVNSLMILLICCQLLKKISETGHLFSLFFMSVDEDFYIKNLPKNSVAAYSHINNNFNLNRNWRLS